MVPWGIRTQFVTSTERPTLLEFPCAYALKVMGAETGDFVSLVTGIVASHVASLPADAVTQRASRGGKYVSVTVYLQAESQAQLDGLYRELSAHERVLMVL